MNLIYKSKWLAEHLVGHVEHYNDMLAHFDPDKSGLDEPTRMAYAAKQEVYRASKLLHMHVMLHMPDSNEIELTIEDAIRLDLMGEE